jgi:hypothetical protein
VELRDSEFLLGTYLRYSEKKIRRVWPLKYGAAAQKRRSNSDIIIEVDSSLMFDKESKRPRDRYEVTVWGERS